MPSTHPPIFLASAPPAPLPTSTSPGASNTKQTQHSSPPPPPPPTSGTGLGERQCGLYPTADERSRCQHLIHPTPPPHPLPPTSPQINSVPEPAMDLSQPDSVEYAGGHGTPPTTFGGDKGK